MPTSSQSVTPYSTATKTSIGMTAGTALLTHTIPAGAELTGPAEGETVSIESLVMSWNPVTETIDGGPVNIIAYQLIIENAEEPHPNMIGKIGLSVYLPPTVTSITIPAEILELGTAYEWEVLAIEESGNQTLSSSEFHTLGASADLSPPDFSSAEFSDSLNIDNLYLPLAVGAQFVYEGEAEDDETGEIETERVEVEMLDEFETILEPDALENKNYAPGLSLILVQEDIDEDGEPGFELELIRIV